MDNPSRILTTLDQHLNKRVRLILYGRAALHLGFTGAPLEIAKSKDVDAIIPVDQLDSYGSDFWDAQEATNSSLHEAGLYITHLFRSDQVFLRSRWEHELLPITSLATRRLDLFRPATLDLILTKMMRGNDSQDLADIEFMVHHDKITSAQVESAFAEAVIPDMLELQDAFKRAQPYVRTIVKEAAY